MPYDATECEINYRDALHSSTDISLLGLIKEVFCHYSFKYVFDPFSSLTPPGIHIMQMLECLMSQKSLKLSLLCCSNRMVPTTLHSRSLGHSSVSFNLLRFSLVHLSFQLLYYSALIDSFINTFYHFVGVFTLLLPSSPEFDWHFYDRYKGLLVGLLNSILLASFPEILSCSLAWTIFCGLILPNSLCLFLVY